MRHALAEQTLRLDLADVRRAGVLAGRPALIPARLDQQVAAHIFASAGPGSDSPGTLLIENVCGPDHLLRGRGEILALASTRCSFGPRLWLVCAGLDGARTCGRRARVLYLTPESGGFRCRRCAHVAYAAQQRHRNRTFEGFAKPLGQLRAIENRLRRARSPVKRAALLARARAAAERLDDFLAADEEKRERRLRARREAVLRGGPAWDPGAAGGTRRRFCGAS